jgi:hypothetical protein
MPAPFVVLLSLRKLAYLPVATVSAVALGAAFGSFDLTRRAVASLFPPAGRARRGAVYVNAGASLTVASFLLAIREVVFLPAFVPPPAVPLGGPSLERLRGAARVARHTLRHYPYKFRFLSACLAGVGGGATWAWVDRAYRVKEAEEAPALAVGPPHL